MRILIVNDRLIFGGSEIYALNLRDILRENGHEVYNLYFDDAIDYNINQISDKSNIINIKTHGLYNKLFFNPIKFLKIKRILNKIKPEVILTNNVFNCPISFYKCVKNIKTINIVHDSNFSCPKSTSIYNKKVCNGYKNNNCLKKCSNEKNKLYLAIKLFQIKKIEKIKKKYIDLFISPSKALKKRLDNLDYKNVIAIPNPILIEEDKYTKKKNKNYLFVGNIIDRKGIYEIIKVFIKNKRELSIIGFYASDEDRKKIEHITQKYDNIKYLGLMSNEEVKKVIKDSYCLIQPSICFENYPTTVLESISMHTLCIGNNIGGIPEIIPTNCLFDINDQKSIENIIEYANSLSEKDYKTIVNKNYNDLLKNNTKDIYYKKISKYL